MGRTFKECNSFLLQFKNYNFREGRKALVPGEIACDRKHII